MKSPQHLVLYVSLTSSVQIINLPHSNAFIRDVYFLRNNGINIESNTCSRNICKHDNSCYSKRKKFISHVQLGSTTLLASSSKSRNVSRNEESWFRRYEELKRYKKSYGNTFVPSNFERNKRLANWVQFQRASYKKKKAFQKSYITDERIELLDEIGFIWDPNEYLWETHFRELQKYKMQYGDCAVPQNFTENQTLGNWVNMQRVHYQNVVKYRNRMSIKPARVKKLCEIGFIWDLHDDTWSKRFAELQEFKSIHDHCLIPHDYLPNPSLGLWANNQRTMYKNMNSGEKPSLTHERFEKLKSIGFCFDILDEQWHKRWEQLRKYKEVHNTCQVDKKIDPSLAQWVDYMRGQYKSFRNGKNSTMTQERIDLLNRIGFIWNNKESIRIGFDIRSKEWIEQDKVKIERRRRHLAKTEEDAWLKRFKELQSYKEEHGDCNVPKGYKECQSLGNWVNTQRVQYKRMKLGKRYSITAERIKMLKGIGFVFDVQEKAWNDKYNRLVNYYHTHNDCLVRQNDKEHGDLGRWVSTMRSAFKKYKAGKKSHLTQERIDMLNKIDFVWDARAHKRQCT